MIGILNLLKKNEIIISSFVILISLFFFDNKILGFNNSKYFILLLFPFFFLNYKDIYFQKIRNFFLIFFLCSILLLFHSGININFQYTNFIIFSFIYLSLLTLICLNLTKNFDRIIDKSINLFILVSNILFLIVAFSEFNEFIFYDHKESYNGLCITLYNEQGSIWNYFFIENSHFAMIGTGVFTYQLYNFKNLNLFRKINFIFFTLMVYMLISSLTLFLGITVSLIICLFIFKLNKTFLTKSIFAILLNIFMIISLDNCLLRISQVAFVENMYLDNKENHLLQIYENTKTYISKGTSSKKILKGKNFYKQNAPETEIIINSTTAVHLNHLNFTLETLKKNIFGVGFQNYGTFAYKYGKERRLINIQNDMSLINIQDGASTINKLLTEFGILNILFLCLFIYSIIKCNLDDKSKIFIITIVITQLLRGAGYFNGGFIFFSLILFLSNYNFYKKRDNIIY